MQEQFIDHAGDGTQKRTPNSRPQIKWDSNDSDPFGHRSIGVNHAFA